MDLFNKLLEYYSFDLKKYNEYTSSPDLSKLVLPSLDNPSFSRLITKLTNLSKSSDKVLIYGDYDVDGLTSTAIIYLTMKKLNKICGYFIPSRYIDGYGITKEKVNYFHSLGYKYIICVDNGISCTNEIELAKELGIEVIIIDHHEIINTIPNTEYIFHHHLYKFVDYEVSAASLSLYVSYYLLNKSFDPYLVFLAGIGVLSDVMPLVGNNLILLKQAYNNYIKYDYLNISSLISKKDFTYDSLSFNLISLLNAPGRVETEMISTIKACKFLIEKDDINQIRSLSKYLLDVNEKKKKLINESKIDEKFSMSSTHSKSFVISGLTGINGLVCSRLLNKYNQPVLVCTSDYKDENNYVCSIRSPIGYNLLEFINSNKKNMISFGGHENACGFTIKKSIYFQIATNFASAMESQYLNKNNDNEKDNYIELSLDDLNIKNYNIVESFEPFGNMHNKPLFKIKVDKSMLKINEKFIKATSNSGGEVVFFSTDLSHLDPNNKEVTFFGNLNKNIFNNKVTIQLLASSIK